MLSHYTFIQNSFHGLINKDGHTLLYACMFSVHLIIAIAMARYNIKLIIFDLYVKNM